MDHVIDNITLQFILLKVCKLILDGYSFVQIIILGANLDKADTRFNCVSILHMSVQNKPPNHARLLYFFKAFVVGLAIAS